MNMMSEIATSGTPAHSVNHKGEYILPAIPANISAELADLIAGYRLGWTSQSTKDHDRMGTNVKKIQAFNPTSLAELCAKLAIAIHWHEPGVDGKTLTVDAPMCPAAEGAIEMELDCLNWLLLRVQTPNQEFIEAKTAYDTVRLALSKRGLPEAEIDRLGDLETETAGAVFAAPASGPADVATKLRTFSEVYAPCCGGVATDILKGILEDVERLAVVKTPIAESPAIMDAFQNFRTTFAEMKKADVNVDTDAFYSVMDPADVILRDTPALSPTGVAMKLKRVFVEVIGERWSDHAVFDNRPAEFAEGIRISDIYHRMFWSAIEDLDRMATEGETTI